MSAAANSTSNGWTTVTSSSSNRNRSHESSPWSSAPRRQEAPAAFARTTRPGGRFDPPPPPSSTAASRERAAEATRVAALDFSSASAYPSLSSTRAASAPTPAPTLNYRGAVVTTEARTATAAADAYEVEYARRRQERLAAEEAERVRRARLAAIGTRSFDDGPEDYDGPEEDEGEGDGYVPAGTGTTDDWEEDASGNAVEEDQIATRRRGDKGVW